MPPPPPSSTAELFMYVLARENQYSFPSLVFILPLELLHSLTTELILNFVIIFQRICSSSSRASHSVLYESLFVSVLCAGLLLIQLTHFSLRERKEERYASLKVFLWRRVRIFHLKTCWVRYVTHI